MIPATPELSAMKLQMDFKTPAPHVTFIKVQGNPDSRAEILFQASSMNTFPSFGECSDPTS